MKADRKCPYGLTLDEVKEIIGPDRWDDYCKFSTGQTMTLCNGWRWSHEKRMLVRTECRETGHGPVTYTVDVEQFLAGRPPLD